MYLNIMDNEFEYQKKAYNNYVKFFIPELQWTNTIYKDLYNGLTDSLEVAKASLGDYYFEQYVNDINENLNRIENEVNTYIQNNNYDKIQKEHLFYHKPLLENRIKELIQVYSSKKASIKEPPQLINNSKTLGGFVFTNNFDNVNENDIVQYFTRELVEKKYITTSTLNEFLELAFNKEMLPTKKFNFNKYRTKQDIVSVFYKYYKIIAGKPHKKRVNYFNLLTNYFIGFENLGIKNFKE